MQLLDGGSDSENEEQPSLKINEEYARRYEHNKNREDLHRYEDLKKRGLVDDPSASDDSSDDNDDDDLVLAASSKRKELEFFDAIIKVKNRDPILKNKEVELFKSDDTEPEDDASLVKDEDSKARKKKSSNETEDSKEEDSKSEKKKKKKKKSEKKKKVYLKDVVANHLLEDGAELPEDDDRSFPKSYNEEQEQIRREFLEAAAKEEDDDEGEMLRVKEGSNAVGDEADEEFDKKLDEYFGQDLDENARFLRDFFKNKMWLDKGDQGRGVKDEDLEMVSEDEVEIEKQEEYEYRFQENAGDQVLGHAREVEGSVRKKVKARKEQRKSKEERMEIARLEREEELRHLKNLKKKENDDRIKKIMKIAGIKEGEESLFDPKELEHEFDPQEYDRMMKKAFNDEYYEDDDTDFMDEGEIEKPDFDKEDELLGLPKGWDGAGSGDGFLAAREKILKLKEETGLDSEEEEESQEEGKEEDGEEEEDKEDDDEEDEEGEGEEKLSEEGEQEKKRKLAILERAKKEMLDEYYKLDYEDTIGDLKTRFRYAKIKPNRFGLTTAELLMMDEKDLNQYVSLKKLAPYAEKEWKVPNSKRNEIKKRAREIFAHGTMDHKKRSKKLRIKDDSKDASSSTPAEEHGKEQIQDSIGDTSKLSRKARRKLNKEVAAVAELPPSRLIAYGTLPPKTKNKVKQ